MSRFVLELENMPLENDIVKFLNDTLEKEDATKELNSKRNKVRPLYDALYNGTALPVEIAGRNEIIFNGHQYGDDFDTGTRVWRLYDYYDKDSEQTGDTIHTTTTCVLVAVTYDSSSYDGDDFESVEFRKVRMSEIVVQVYN